MEECDRIKEMNRTKKKKGIEERETVTGKIKRNRRI